MLARATPGCAAPTGVAEGLVEALRAPFGLAGRTLAVSASVGVATTEPGRR